MTETESDVRSSRSRMDDSTGTMMSSVPWINPTGGIL